MNKKNIYPKEKVLSALPVKMKTGLFSSENYHLVLINKRLIFAVFDLNQLMQTITETSKKNKGQGKNRWSQILSSMETRSNYSQRYLFMEPEAILEENNDNFYCDHGLVHRIDLKKNRTAYHNDGEYKGEEPTSITIKTTDVSYKLVVEDFGDITNLKKHLENIFPHKFKVK